MVPEFVEAIALYVSLVRDIVLLLLLVSILLIMFLIYKKISSTIGSLNRMLKSTEEMISTVSDSLVRPATSGSSVAFGLGKIIAFLRGARR